MPTRRRRLPSTDPFACAVVCVLVAVTLPTHAQTLNEYLKLTADDAAAGFGFGSSTAISGTLTIVGEPNYTFSTINTDYGSAYLFDTTTGQQLFQLAATDRNYGDHFGISVGVSGTTAIVGAYADDDAGNGSGSAYLFDTTTGHQLFKLTADDAAAGDSFGYAVAISGTIAIVGSPYDGTTNTGSAYLFDTSTGHQLFKLTADDAAADDDFGYAVAVSGTIAIVGAYGDDDAGSLSGSAYVFDTSTGSQLFKLTASDAAAGDTFGSSVALSGTMAIVGSFGDDDAGDGSGSAYLFDTTTGHQLFKLTADDAAAGDAFGSVAISGTIAIVGALGDDDAGADSGSAYVFDTTTGQQLLKLIASDAAAGDALSRVAISATTVIAGARGDDDAGGGSGSAYLFRLGSCLPDLNADGTLNLDDVNLFASAFVSGDLAADLDGNGVLNLDDINLFAQSFLAGCP